MPATPQSFADPDTDTIVTPLCAWCRMHPAETTGYCCELHQEAHAKGYKHPTPQPYTYDDGYGCCVWCGIQLEHPDCCGGDHPDAHSLSAQLNRAPAFSFGAAR
jgi:hypothetical protein